MHSSKIVVKTKTKGNAITQVPGYTCTTSDHRESPLRQIRFGANSGNSFPKGRTTVQEQVTSVPGGQVRSRTAQYTSSSQNGPFTTVTSKTQSAPFHSHGSQFTTVPKGSNVNMTFDKGQFSKPVFEIEKRRDTSEKGKISNSTPSSYKPTTHVPTDFPLAGRVSDRSKQYNHGIPSKVSLSI